MSGPPTPPPTSAIEFEDAARTSIAPEAAAATAAQPADGAQRPHELPPVPVQTATLASNHYRQLFPVIVDLAVNERYQELVEVAELGDLNSMQDAHADRLLLTVPLVLSYLILDDIPPAVYALTRLPDILHANPLPQDLFKLTASVSERKYTNIYSRATEVYNTAQHPDVISEDLRLVVTGLLDKFLDRFRRKTFALLSRAYTSIPVSLVQSYLNLPANQVLSVAAEHKWQIDTSIQVLSPAPALKELHVARLSGQSDLATFNMIANMNLE